MRKPIQLLIVLIAFVDVSRAAPVSSKPEARPKSDKSELAKGSGGSTGAAQPKATRVLTRAVGEVGEQVVTSREVRINAAIGTALELALRSRDSRVKNAPLRIPDGEAKEFPSEVGKVLDEWVVYLEAKSLSNQPSTHLDVAAAVKVVEETWGAHSAWRELEVSAEELREMLERKLIAKEFERLKSDPQLAPVTDEDALAYYRKNRLKFGSLPFSTFKDNIKSFLIQQQTERRLAEWRDVLRRKYKVRNFIAG